MAKDPVKSEENEETSEDGRDNMQTWFSENLRMIVSIVIVIVIAGGIYSYSKRTQSPTISSESASTEESSEGKISVIGGDSEKTAPEESPEQLQENEQPQPTTPNNQTGSVTTQNQTSQETETAFTETAVKGDSTTKLARKALANYLEKNPDASLTAEHKIYIEDFLRRQVKNGHLRVGETRDFSKDMIAKGIEKSKGLNEKQLKNLQKFAKRVPDLK